MLKQQFREVTAAFKPRRPVFLKFGLVLALIPATVAAAVGTYLAIITIWTYAYSPFDLSGLDALAAIQSLGLAAAIWFVALLGWWLALRLARIKP